jgi:hypothetical protein
LNKKRKNFTCLFFSSEFSTEKRRDKASSKKEVAMKEKNVLLEGQSRFSKANVGRRVLEDLFFQLHLQAKDKNF